MIKFVYEHYYVVVAVVIIISISCYVIHDVRVRKNIVIISDLVEESSMAHEGDDVVIRRWKTIRQTLRVLFVGNNTVKNRRPRKRKSLHSFSLMRMVVRLSV